ncbi:MAG: ATP-binding protein [Capsulimonadales bacterium]|nr:ATP-binding protein [Capsulimonadales bacterium]
MPTDGESMDTLRDRLLRVEAELEKRNDRVKRLEKEIERLQQQIQEAQGQPAVDFSEMEEALKRLLTRVVMILAASKALFMVSDTKTGELFADTPAIGFEDADVRRLRIKDHLGISGEVFRENQPVILYDAEADDRAAEEQWSRLGIRNGLCVPLVIEKRDEETNAVIERRTFGVLWVFNKKFGNAFIAEDVQLLTRMSRNAAAIINAAETFKILVKERDEALETIESLSMGLIMVNTNQRITQMNHSALRIFGLTKEDLAGGRTYDAVIKDEKVRELLRRSLEEDADVSAEVPLTNPDNPDHSHTFQVQSATVRNEIGEAIGSATIFNDITEIKNVDKMKTAFVSTVSHELRTPLTAIKGFISTLVQDTEGFFDNNTRHEFYTIIDTECDRLRRLIDDLLNVSRIEANAALEMNLTKFNLRETLDKVIAIQSGSTYKKENHSLSWEMSPDVPTEIEADQDKIEQVFHNLIGNALKYAPGGGPVQVTGKLLPGGEMLEFAISDRGIGMSDAFLKKVGEKFARADNRDTRTIGGTGIGLFLVKAFVEGHGGRMWPHSEGEGKGSTFFFTLPLNPNADGRDGNLGSRVAG